MSPTMFFLWIFGGAAFGGFGGYYTAKHKGARKRENQVIRGAVLGLFLGPCVVIYLLTVYVVLPQRPQVPFPRMTRLPKKKEMNQKLHDLVPPSSIELRNISRHNLMMLDETIVIIPMVKPYMSREHHDDKRGTYTLEVKYPRLCAWDYKNMPVGGYRRSQTALMIPLEKISNRKRALRSLWRFPLLLILGGLLGLPSFWNRCAASMLPVWFLLGGLLGSYPILGGDPHYRMTIKSELPVSDEFREKRFLSPQLEVVMVDWPRQMVLIDLKDVHYAAEFFKLNTA